MAIFSAEDCEDLTEISHDAYFNASIDTTHLKQGAGSLKLNNATVNGTGSDAEVILDDVGYAPAGKKILGFWFKGLTRTTDTQIIIMWECQASGHAIVLYIKYNSDESRYELASLVVADNGSAETYLMTYALNTWYYIQLDWEDANTQKIYVNGSLLHTFTNEAVSMGTNCIPGIYTEDGSACDSQIFDVFTIESELVYPPQGFPSTLQLARGRIEIHHGPPTFFDDHFKSGWTLDTAGTSSKSSDGDILTISSGDQNPATVSYDVTNFSSDTYTKLAIRIKSVLTGTWGIDLYYDGGWNNLLTGQSGTGLVETAMPAGKTIEQIRIRAETTNCLLDVDYISFNKTAVVIPLSPPDTQDIFGTIETTSRVNRLSTAHFLLMNVPTSFLGTGPYTDKLENKDVVIIWGYRYGDTMDETHKLFGGVIKSYGIKAEKSNQHLIPVNCIDHGWELMKPPTLFNSRYSATNGKTILVAAVDLCSYLDSSFVDDASEINSTHSVDYSEQGREVVPFDVLEEIAPKCVTSGGAVGFDWRVTPAGIVDLFPRDSISTGITLTDVDLEFIDREKDWWRCFNDIIVYGRAEKSLPSSHDWCEGSNNNTFSDSAEDSTTDANYVLVCETTLGTGTDETQRLRDITLDISADAGSSIGYKATYELDGGGEVTIVESAKDPTDYPTFETITHSTSPLPVWGSWQEQFTLKFYIKRTAGAGTVYAKNYGAHYDRIDNAFWSVEGSGVALTIDEATYVRGSASLKLQCTATTVGNFYLGVETTADADAPTGIDLTKYRKIHFWLYVEDVANVQEHIQLRLVDENGYTADKFIEIMKGQWRDFAVDVGYQAEEDWNLSNTNFDWTDIDVVRIYVFASANATWYNLIDGFYFGERRYSGSANNSTSITAWGTLKRSPEVDESLNTDAECDKKAEGILAYVESPLISIKNTRLVKGQKQEVGETVELTLTTPNISETVRIVSVTHILTGVDWDSNYNLSNEPTEISYLFLEQQRKLKLALRGKTK